ncbi:hypothetical protein ABNX05_11350 [Lysinibacillus sp. M3]|uniref:Uncharacterized protein n=1 Tax=Lysinibacillus zambalensis TaxID=3160866 RepID=A0ABV1MUD1_9BACI
MRSIEETIILVKESISELNLKLELLKVEMTEVISENDLENIKHVSKEIYEVSEELLKDIEHLEELELIRD